MRGEGVLRDHSESRRWSCKRTLNGCDVKRNLDNVVLIDVDNERLENVIIIDVPESLRKGKKIRFGSVISIDDDEDAGYSEMGTGGGGDLESDSSSSKSCPAPERTNKSVNLGDDECQVVQEKNYASRVSKCKKASGKDPCSNRFGLFESSSSDSDSSDCEVMEGSFGRLHKEWEKAYLKRRSNAHQGKSGVDEQASPSSLNSEPRPDVDVEAEKRTEKHSKTSFCCNSSNASYNKQKFNPFVPTNDRDLHVASLNPGIKCPTVESDKKVDQERNSSPKKADIQFREETCMENPLSNSSWWQNYKRKDRGGASSFHNDGQSPPGSFFSSKLGDDDEQCHHTRTSDMVKQQNFMGVHFNYQGSNQSFDHKNTRFEDKEASLCKGQQSSETHDDPEQVVPSEKYEEISRATSSCSSSPRNLHHSRTVFVEKDKSISGDPLMSNSRPSCETRAECGVAPFEYNGGAVFEGSFSCKIPSSGMPEVHENSGQQVAEKPVSEGVSSCKTQCIEQQSNQGSPRSAEIKQQVIGSFSNNKLNGGVYPIHTQGVTLTPTSADDIINEREKLKETDEYKQAMEEEWASRQRQLQIQAEEAQRLRKKRRAENMRLLDMERRQKQRLEEIRETQKKDEENMSLKEKLRVEVRKELNKLETTCIDMASLLRALGIHVGGSFLQPLSQEVHAAYKRALLRFHPDRASKTDVRQQVEAEEKFKLISRMKEKFLLTTCP